MTSCVFCVMDDSDPDITFDEAGQCHHCKRAQAQLASRGSQEVRAQRVQDKIAQIKQRNAGKAYDVIMGVSGGVDSSYALIKA